MHSRDHWVAAADRLLDGVLPYATPGFAQYRLPGRTSWAGQESDGLEGFARTFLLAAFRGGDVLERYAEGLTHGTDPQHRFAWQAITDGHQTIVEAASIALALHESQLFWHLDAGVQERVADWLGGIVGKHAWPCNWVLFKVIVEQFLANVGAPYSAEEIERHLADVEGWYVGDGWYTDGAGQNYDYYCGWAIHLYTLWWTRMSGADPGVYRERLRQFLEGYQHFFAHDGAPIHQGRSLTYRMATVAPLWLGALFDATPLEMAQTRELAGRVLNHFSGKGVPGDDGLLSLGWYRPYLPVTQGYSGPASPYWASKGFLGLVMGPDHPVWTSSSAATAQKPAPDTVALPAPGWLLHSSQGVVRLINHGSDGNDPDSSGADPHYVKLAYSTHSAPSGLDNELIVTRPDGSVARRRRIDRLAVADDRFAASRFFEGEIVVESATVLDGPWEIRIHRVAAPAGSMLTEGGYAVSSDSPCANVTTDLQALAVGDVLRCTIFGLYGWQEADISLGTNAIAEHAAVPYLIGSHPEGRAVYVGAVWLGDDPPVPPDVSVEGDIVSWNDFAGGHLEVKLGRTPHYIRRTPSGERVVWTS